MNKKTFLVIFGLSPVTTYGLAFVDHLANESKGSVGLPFGFSRFNFFGAETDQVMLILDIAFWFVVIWITWRMLLKVLKR